MGSLKLGITTKCYLKGIKSRTIGPPLPKGLHTWHNIRRARKQTRLPFGEPIFSSTPIFILGPKENWQAQDFALEKSF